MGNEFVRPLRFDMSAGLDVGSYGGDLTGGGSVALTLLAPPFGCNPLSIAIGGRVEASGYWSGDSEFIDLTPDEENPARASTYLVKDGVSGLRAFFGLEVDIPLSDIVSLRFSPGGIFRYDDVLDYDGGAAFVSALMIDLPSSATLAFHFGSDIYTYSQIGQMLGGIELGFTL